MLDGNGDNQPNALAARKPPTAIWASKVSAIPEEYLGGEPFSDRRGKVSRI